MPDRIKRVLKHLWLDATSAQRAVTPDALERLEQRVTASERHHCGEIRIYVETGLPLSYLWRNASTAEITRQRALSLFGKLRVWDTAGNNGVLIYLMLAEHAIEVVADRGLHHRVEPQRWQNLIARLSAAFHQGRFEEGLNQALDEVSDLLVTHFPLEPGQINPNELPDAPILG